jgi:hypothetical protein
LTWNEGNENGGSAVIDYTITYGEDTGSYNNIIAGITITSFDNIGLTAGVTYKFKVQARNEFGLSDYSSEVLILAAQLPDTPDAPTTLVVNSNVHITWVAPNDQGIEIQGY